MKGMGSLHRLPLTCVSGVELLGERICLSVSHLPLWAQARFLKTVLDTVSYQASRGGTAAYI